MVMVISVVEQPLTMCELFARKHYKLIARTIRPGMIAWRLKLKVIVNNGNR